MADRWTIFDLAEGFQLAHAVAALHDEAVFLSLARSATVGELAAKHGIDEAMLRGVLEYVAARTNILKKRGQRYVVTEGYTAEARFLLDQYVGAYGGNATQLRTLMQNPNAAAKAVDRERHARAFGELDGPGVAVLSDLVVQLQLQLSNLLDLGCGPAALLVQLAERDAAFNGWGVDSSRAMCRAARQRIGAANVRHNIKVFEGDCTNLPAAVPATILAKIGSVTAASVANEFFAEGQAKTIAWLRHLRTLIPGRPLLIADYYGRLGQSRKPFDRELGLHDYVQTISGQGVPPADLRSWRKIYVEAGCTLVHVLEDQAATCFVHILRL